MEEYISLSEAAKLLPGKPSLNSIWRWRSRGVRGVRLMTWIIGGRKRYTTLRAIREFIEAVTAAEQFKNQPEADGRSESVRARLKAARLLSDQQ